MAALVPWRRRETGIEQWDPFGELEEMHSRMGKLLDTAFGMPERAIGAWSPLVDVEETEDAWIVEAELPGVKREDVDVEFRDGELTISGEIKQKERRGILRRQVRRTGRFEYRLSVPGMVDGDKIEASLDKGVLTVRIPKEARAKPKRIEVRAGS